MGSSIAKQKNNKKILEKIHRKKKKEDEELNIIFIFDTLCFDNTNKSRLSWLSLKSCRN